MALPMPVKASTTIPVTPFSASPSAPTGPSNHAPDRRPKYGHGPDRRIQEGHLNVRGRVDLALPGRLAWDTPAGRKLARILRRNAGRANNTARGFRCCRSPARRHMAGPRGMSPGSSFHPGSGTGARIQPRSSPAFHALACVCAPVRTGSPRPRHFAAWRRSRSSAPGESTAPPACCGPASRW